MMRKNLFITLLILSTSILAQEKIDKGVFQFESETIDYGTIAQNADGKRIFTFKNIGTDPILITKVKGSCGCTVATIPQKAIMPGETAEIGVNYATNRTGRFSKTITIVSNASETTKVLRIKGNVLKEKSNLTVSN